MVKIIKNIIGSFDSPNSQETTTSDFEHVTLADKMVAVKMSRQSLAGLPLSASGTKTDIASTR
jgi:hypothetical protein